MEITAQSLTPLFLLMLGMIVPRAVDGTWKGEGHPLEYFILEELPAGTLIGNVAVDYKLTEKFNATILEGLSYSFDKDKSTREDLFSIGADTGIVSTAVEIDRDAICPGNEKCDAWLHIKITPSGISEDINIILEIVDINDNRPVFENKSMEVSIAESSSLGTVVTLPTATDIDSGKNGVSTYELVSDSDLFTLEVTEEGRDSPTGAPDDKVTPRQRLELKLVGKLDREHGGFYNLKLVAHDGGSPVRSGSMLINVTVVDVNDHDPRFDNATYTANIPENGPVGALVAVVQAHDFDLGDNAAVTYTFDERTQSKYGMLFELDAQTGRIITKKSLDFEEGSTYLLIVRAHDKGETSRPGEAAVVVRVIDENDNTPVINLHAGALSASGEVEIAEDIPVGSDIGRLTVSDLDGGDNGRVTCDMRAPSAFSLHKVHQAHFRLVTTSQLDRETRQEYILTLICRDLGVKPNIATQDVIVRIIDVNDNAPVFSENIYSRRLPSNQPLRQSFLQVQATDPDAGNNGLVRYSIHRNAADRFSINPTSGAVSLKTQINLETGAQLRFRVIATDLGVPSKSATATVLLTTGTAPTPPKFTLGKFEFGVFENLPSKTLVGDITLNALDPRDYQFSLERAESEEDISELFEVNSETGALLTRVSFDREEKPAYYMKVRASHRDKPDMSDSVSVTVYIADKNDNGPVLIFPTDYDHSVFISDYAVVDTEVTSVKASDPDLGGNGKLTYKITAGNEAGYFKLNPISGLLTIARELSDRDGKSQTKDSFTLRVLVSDNGDPRFMTSATLEVIVNRTSGIVGPEISEAQQDLLVDPAYATVVVAVTAACLITVFLVLFAVMIFLLWRRMGQPLSARRQQHSSSSKYCYSNMEAPADPTLALDGGSVIGSRKTGPTPSPPLDTCRKDVRRPRPLGPQQPGPSGLLRDTKCSNAAVKNTDFCLSIDCKKPQNLYVENNILLQGESSRGGGVGGLHPSRDSRVYSQNALCTPPASLVTPDVYDERTLDSDESFVRNCPDSYTNER